MTVPEERSQRPVTSLYRTSFMTYPDLFIFYLRPLILLTLMFHPPSLSLGEISTHFITSLGLLDGQIYFISPPTLDVFDVSVIFT